MHKLVKSFFKERVISEDIELGELLHNTILYLEQSNEIVNKLLKDNLKKVKDEVPWSSMHDMYKRSHNHVSGAVTLFIVTQIHSSEALCRTALESSVNLHYISLDNSTEKLISYFKDYISTERKQNVNWKDSVTKSNYPAQVKTIQIMP